jgi:hypothetical protein
LVGDHLHVNLKGTDPPLPEVRMPLSRRVLLGVGILAALSITGCSAHSTTLLWDEPNARQVIYRVSEETAFTTALEAYAALYPNKSVDDVVDGRRRGYNADERSWAGDVWHHTILVIPAIATDTAGKEVRGYWYDYEGSGSYAPTTERTKGLMQFIRARLNQTAVVVTKVRDGSYETDGRAFLGMKRDARDIPPTLQRAPAQSNADRLDELKTMRDRGLITDGEYEAKRRQILDRM